MVFLFHRFITLLLLLFNYRCCMTLTGADMHLLMPELVRCGYTPTASSSNKGKLYPNWAQLDTHNIRASKGKSISAGPFHHPFISFKLIWCVDLRRWQRTGWKFTSLLRAWNNEAIFVMRSHAGTLRALWAVRKRCFLNATSVSKSVQREAQSEEDIGQDHLLGSTCGEA